MTDQYFTLFDTPIGICGIEWGPRGINGVQLPMGVSNRVKCWSVMAGSNLRVPHVYALGKESRLGICCDPPGFRGEFAGFNNMTGLMSGVAPGFVNPTSGCYPSRQ